jgi:hypothetical protein
VATEVALGPYSLGRLVFALDERLRRRLSVFDYVDHHDCILRIRIGAAHEEVVLGDGLRVRPGDRWVDLHLWNEHMPDMGDKGPSVGWARRTAKLLDFSLRELSQYLAARPHLDDIAVIRAVMPLRGEQSRHVQFIASKFGFESIDEATPRSLGARLHCAGENALGLLLTLASNPAAAHLDILMRGRAPLFLSRQTLDRRYRACAAQPALDGLP